MDYTDRLIDAAVSNYAPDKSIKKRIFDKIMSKSCKKNTDSSNITVVYVSSDAEKILKRFFQKPIRFSESFRKWRMKFLRNPAFMSICK